MNIVVRKLVAAATTTAMLLSGIAFASETPQPDVSIYQPATYGDLRPAVNGAVAPNVTVLDIDGVTMMPLLQVAEALGYTVSWNGEARSIEMTKGAQYITMATDRDAYAFSRMAPQPLGAPPAVVEGVTYVPLALVTEIIGGYYRENSDGTLDIINPSVVTVSSVGEDGSILVEDSFFGQVLVWIDENTEIVAPATAADIQEGMTLDVEYGPAMTNSIPPQTTAVRIELPIDDAQ